MTFYDWLQRYTGEVEFAVLARKAASDEAFPRETKDAAVIRRHVKANGGTCQWKRAFMKAWFHFAKQEGLL